MSLISEAILMITNVVVHDKKLTIYTDSGNTLILSIKFAEELKKYLDELL